MSRPVTWIHRLSALRLAVDNSEQNHFSSKNIMEMFQLQSRSAQIILAALPTTPVGGTNFVDRATLLDFLDRVATASGDLNEVLRQLKREKKRAKQKKDDELKAAEVVGSLRVSKDLVLKPAATSLPPDIYLQRGEVRIAFSSAEDLATSMYWILRLLSEKRENFEAEFLPRPALPEDSSEVADMFHELEQMEAKFAISKQTNPDSESLPG